VTLAKPSVIGAMQQAGWGDMNPYAVIGSGIGTPEAVAFGVRLAAWHDAMVAHERRLRASAAKDGCHDECPHAEAGTLWSEALETFGPRAHELTFLHSRGKPATFDALAT
jgi:hypothetical protein